MITAKEISEELQDVLNGVSPNIPDGANRPFDGLFSVKTPGFHIDSVYDPKTGTNFFPVFMEGGTGEFNPIKDLEQIDYSFPVSIYFPVRFKEKMLAMQEYLAKCFVGQTPLFAVYDESGELSYKQGAVTNISAFELGEITDLDLDQYGQSVLKNLNAYISEQYKMPISNMEPWLVLSFTLYVSTMKGANAEGGYVYGNAFKTSLIVSRETSSEETETLTEEIKCDGFGLSYTASTETQQGFELGSGEADPESESLTITSARGQTFEALVRDNDFWNYLLGEYSKGKLSQVKAVVSVSSATDGVLSGLSFSIPAVITSMEMAVDLGSPITCKFTFGKKASVDNG